ncbi:hypothetical protein BH10PSE7_BH10PSE7_05250 [soil metagenome]
MQDAGSVPTLEDLRHAPRPAWLWDAGRCRVVWANTPAITFFGGETLFDMLDRPFDRTEPGVEHMDSLVRELKRGERRKVLLHFPSAGSAIPVRAFCSIHALADGRPGLLVEQLAETNAKAAAPTELASAFDDLPIAALLVEDNEIFHSNDAARDLFGNREMKFADRILGGAETSDQLLKRIIAAGAYGTTRKLATALGERDIKITAKVLPRRPGRKEALVLLFEDVTERRAVERQLSHLANLPETRKAPELTEQDAAIFANLGKALLASESRLAAAPENPAVPEKAAPSAPSLPSAITLRVDALPHPVLIAQADRIEYANSKALALLGYGDVGELAGATVFPVPLAANREPAELDITRRDGTPLRLRVQASTIAWRNGPAMQVTLSEIPAAPIPVPKPAPVETVRAEPPRPEPKPLPTVKAEPAPMRAAPMAITEDAELRSILDTAADGIITLDAKGAIRTFSAAAESIFGYRIADVADKPLASLLAPESRKTLRDYLSALQGPGLATVFNDGREVVAKVRQGGEVPLFLTIGKLHNARPDGAAFCAVVRDITQWKRTEAELREARDHAEEASRQKSEFLAKISHELRTPLNAILGFSEVMRLERFGEIRNDKYRGYVNDIHSSGSHLLSLINDLLDLSKVEAGKLELNFTAVNLADVTEHSFRLMQEQANSARVILRKSFPAKLPNVVADLRSMRQIVLNLLSNAVKFTEPGGQVIVSAQLMPAGDLILRVKDTGIGMNESEIKDALQPFRRVSTDGRDVPGTGLGLPLTKALAEANRAIFGISSEKRKGTLVEITFPMTRVLAD